MPEKTKDITQFIMQLHGIDVSRYDDSFLWKSIQKCMKDLKCQSEDDYYAYLQKNNKESVLLINALTVSYTDFFRNALSFAVLEQIIFPSLLQKIKENKQKEIRIWCAACAAGHEAYSVAMLLEELKIAFADKFNYRIFATDLSQLQINEAQQGKYSETAINNMNIKRLKQWFTKQGNIYTINPELKRNIDFSVFDMFNDNLNAPPASIFGNFDLVICANLLFYYKPEYQKILIKKASQSKSKGGFLMTGETERDILLKNNYNEVYLKSGIFQKK